MRAYLDTDLWNASCDQKTDPRVLLESMDRRGWTPVFGIHVLYELLKNFATGNSERGCQLFSHVQAYLAAGLRCISKDVSESLVAEMYGLKGAIGAEKFLPFDDVEKITCEIARLSKGDVKSEWYEHISEQQRAAARDRDQVRNGISGHKAHRELLLNVSEHDLGSWLAANINTKFCNEILFGHLHRRFPKELVAELKEYSHGLLNAETRTAGALVRADIYYAWRCAHRGSNPKDLLDDIYHVLSASYCDVYATGERKQAEYASKLLCGDVRVCTYSRETRLDEWMLSVVAR